MRGSARAALVVVVVLLAGAFLGSAYAQWSRRATLTTVPSGPAEGLVVSERVRVEVLNAGGVAGLAREATEHLRRSGFDVVFFGNAGAFDYDSSLVLDRVGRLDAARAVADAMGIHNVRSEPDSNLYLDVSVMLGSEWTTPEPSADAAPDSARTWWDPRGWIGR